MYKEIKRLSSTLDEYTLIPSSATERDQMMKWFPHPQIPGHVTRYEWDAKLERLRVWQEPVPGEGAPAAAKAAAGAKPATPASDLPPDRQPGTYVPELQKLSAADLETRAAELGVEGIAQLKKKPGHLLAAVARKMAEAATPAA